MPEPRTQIAIAVVEREGCFLVGQRPEGKSLAGYAEFPGGRVEDGETPEQAAIRECLEETGLLVRVVGSYGNCRHEYSHDAVQLHFLACRVIDENASARNPFCWVLRAELARQKFPEANRDLVRQLLSEPDRC